MDRLKAMTAFVRAVELGSLSAAARELHTTQPTVSKLVAALEHSVGARLLERSSTRAVPTDEGLRFLDSARRLLEDYDEAVAELGQRRREAKGLVRISAPVALGELRLNRLMLQALARTHWNVTRAAKLLGLSRDTLRYRIEKLDLKPPPARQ